MQPLGTLEPCHACLIGKACKRPFKSHFLQTKFCGEIVHSDVAGPLPKAIEGQKYFVTFVDQFSRYTHVACIRHKSEVASSFRAYQDLPETRKYFNSGVVQLHTDGGSEYFSIKSVYKTTTTPETPQHNPYAERINRTILDPVRTILEESGLSRQYWTFAVEHVLYVKNRIPHSALNGSSPYELLTKKKPSLNHIRVFGCAAFLYNHHRTSKVHGRGIPGIHLGGNDNGVYIVECLGNRKLVSSVHVTFDESCFPALENPESSSEDESESFSENNCFTESEELETFVPDNGGDHDQDKIVEAEISNTVLDMCDADSSAQEQECNLDDTNVLTLERPKRKVKLPERYGFRVSTAIPFPITTLDQPSVSEAMKASPSEVSLWKEAINDEFKNLLEKETWKPVHPVDYRTVKPLPTHVVLKIKRDNLGNPAQFKARVVAGGNLQIQGQDFDTVFSPVADFTLVLFTLCLCLSKGWVARHIDVKAAFLNGDVDRDIYVRHPFNVPAELKSHTVYKLLKALYGLRQAPLQWFSKLEKVLTLELCYKQLQSDNAVFQKHMNSTTILILAYVDDLVFLSNSRARLQSEIDQFLKHFEGKSEQLHWYLGVQFKIYNDFFIISQKSYIWQTLKDFGLLDINTYSTPMISNFYDEVILHKSDQPVDETNYRAMIGALLFLARRTRPDISTAVGILSQFSNQPTVFIMHCVKRVFGYLKGTANLGIRLTFKSHSTGVKFYADSDYAGDKSDSQSRSG